MFAYSPAIDQQLIKMQFIFFAKCAHICTILEVNVAKHLEKSVLKLETIKSILKNHSIEKQKAPIIYLYLNLSFSC